MALRDLTGQRFGALVVTPQHKPRYLASGTMKTMWLCECDCGKSHWAASQSLTRVKNRTSSCGCKRSEIQAEKMAAYHGKQSLAGRVFGLLTVDMEQTKSAKIKGQNFWRCRCACGSEIHVTRYCLEKGQSSCGCLRTTHGDLKRELVDGGGGIWKPFWQRVKRGAAARGLSFEITPAYVADLFARQEGRCALTNWPIELAEGSLQTASIDRIDSRRGYVPGNVQWLHKRVNRMKLDFEEVELHSICAAIVNHSKVSRIICLAA